MSDSAPRLVSDPAELIELARSVLDAALEPDLRDDRFSESWAASLPNDSTAPGQRLLAAARGADALVVGVLDDGAIQFDGLVNASAVSDPGVALSDLLAIVLPEVPEEARVELWAKPATDAHEFAASEHDLAPLRALHQMRCTLPVSDEPVETRSFVPGQDEQALLRVNNRAFADHPDQGGMTLEDLAAASAEPWFKAEGIRLHEVDGAVAGFCWTKIHAEPALGEIYAIGVDPDHHGKGLGVPMTAAGLDWLSKQGLTTGMLYVEADNVPAIRTYDRLGFTILRTDKAWVR